MLALAQNNDCSRFSRAVSSSGQGAHSLRNVTASFFVSFRSASYLALCASVAGLYEKALSRSIIVYAAPDSKRQEKSPNRLSDGCCLCRLGQCPTSQF